MIIYTSERCIDFLFAYRFFCAKIFPENMGLSRLTEKVFAMTKKKRKSIILGLVSVVVCVFCVFSFFSKKTSKQTDLTIVFNKSGNVSEYKTSGFSAPENDCTWTKEEFASVEVPLPEIADDKFFRVSFDAAPFIAKWLKKRNVSVLVNDEPVTDFVMTKSGIYKFALPQDSQKLGKVANIKFKIAKQVSPKDLGLSADSRKLGICVKNLTLSTADKGNPNGFEEYKIGKNISFSKGGNSNLYTESGWSNQENGLTWTDGQDAYVNMFVNGAKGKSLKLVVEGSAIFAPTDKYQNVTVYVNDKELTTWLVSRSPAFYNVVIPADVVADGALSIRFHIAKPFSPKLDSRHLGFAVKSMELSSRFGAQTKTKVASWVKDKVLTDSEEATKNVK